LVEACIGRLYGAFRDASPDYWGRLVIASRMKCPIEALSEADYLVQANARFYQCINYGIFALGLGLYLWLDAGIVLLWNDKPEKLSGRLLSTGL
jgi:hypothetical protein